MTVKLYENDSYIKEFDATVISSTECEKGYLTILDKTAFFPEGGGQQADKGTINGEAVLDVQIKDEIVTHLTKKQFEIGENVHCVLDWDTRFSRMQNHTGEHLISGIIHSLFNYDNIGFHMSENTFTLDTSGILSDDDIKKIELLSNKAVYENREITVSYPDSTEIDNIEYRAKLDLKEGVRLVHIDGYDTCACCAPHVKYTGEIGVIKIIDYIQYKGGMRLTAVCGINAYLDYAVLHNENKELMHLLSASRDKVNEFVRRDHEVIGTQKAEINALKAQLASSNLETVELNATLCGFTKGASFDDMRNLVNDNLDKADFVALFSTNDDNSLSYVIASKENDVRDTVKAMNEKFSGKGGGRPNYAQGKIEATKDDLLKFFEN